MNGRWMIAAAMVAGCGGDAKPATTAPRPAPPKKVVKPLKTVKVMPVEPAYDEPAVACSDPPSQLQIARMEAPPSLDPELEQRGWVDVGELVFRKGCIPPTDLQYQLEERETALRDCFHAASAASYFTAQVRLEWSWQYGMIEVDATALRLPRDEYDAPAIDEAALLPCVAGAVATVYVPSDADLPAIVDVEIERGFPVEGGVVGGVP